MWRAKRPSTFVWVQSILWIAPHPENDYRERQWTLPQLPEARPLYEPVLLCTEVQEVPEASSPLATYKCIGQASKGTRRDVTTQG